MPSRRLVDEHFHMWDSRQGSERSSPSERELYPTVEVPVDRSLASLSRSRVTAART